MDGTESSKRSRDDGLIVALTVLSIVPLLYPPILPLSDLPAHMARFSIAQMIDTDPYLRQFYTYRWRPIGNLGLDVPVFFLAKLAGVELATKIFVAAIPALGTAGLLLTYRRLHGELSPFAVLAACLVYSSPFHWGFVNYWLGICAGWLVIYFDIRNHRSRTTEALFLLCAGGLLWFTHALVCGLVGSIMLAVRLGRLCKFKTSAIFLELVRFVPFVILPAAMQTYWITSSGAPSGTSGFFQMHDKATALIRVFMYDDYLTAATMAAVLAVCAVSFGIMLGARVKRSAACAFLITAALFIFVPQTFMQSWGADLRIAPLLLMCGLVMLAPHRRSAPAMALASIVFVGFTLVWVTSYARQSERLSGILDVLQPVRTHSRLAQIHIGDCNVEGWPPIPTTQNIKDVVVGRKHVFTPVWNFSGMNLLEPLYHASGNPEVPTVEGVLPASCSRPGVPLLEETLETFPTDAFDYVVVVGTIPLGTIFPASFSPLTKNNEAYLFELPGRDRPVPFGRQNRPTD